jgi:hypothetical protein
VFVVVDVPATVVSIQQTFGAISYFQWCRRFAGNHPDDNESDPKKKESKEPICSGVKNDGDDGCDYGYQAFEAECWIQNPLHSTHFAGKSGRASRCLSSFASRERLLSLQARRATSLRC